MTNLRQTWENRKIILITLRFYENWASEFVEVAIARWMKIERFSGSNCDVMPTFKIGYSFSIMASTETHIYLQLNIKHWMFVLTYCSLRKRTMLKLVQVNRYIINKASWKNKLQKNSAYFRKFVIASLS